MNRLLWAGVLAVIAGLWAGAGEAAAQPPAPPRLGSAPPPPGFSPYLNLIRGNRGANYYGIVRPQQYFQGAIQGLQAQDQLFAAAMNNPEGGELPGTGVPAGFMTHHVYFMNMGAAGFGMGTGMTGGRPAAPQIGTGAAAATAPPPRTR